MLRSLSRAIRPLRHLRLEKCCNSNQKSTFRSGTNVGNCVRAFTSQPDPQLANATRGIKEGITLYNTENFTASEGVFRTVLQHLTNDSTGHSRTEKIFEVAAKLNLANSLREQYKLDAKPELFTEANSLYETTVKSIEAIYGEHHIRLSKALREHALLLQAVGDVESVEKVIRDAIAVHVMWSKVNEGRDSVQDVSEEREVRVIECRERVELLVMLAKSLQAQGKATEVAQLEEPIFKCIEYVELLDPTALPSVLNELAVFQKAAGMDDSKTLEAIEMLKAEKMFNESQGTDEQ